MNTTNEQRGPFDWHEFPEWRARFIGGIRGVDELGHEGFVVEADGFPAMYGEIKRKFTENRNDYNLEIVSCGWPGKEWLGMPRPGLSYRFSEKEWAVIKSIVVRLVNAVKNYEDRPSFLTEYPTAHFLENVFLLMAGRFWMMKMPIMPSHSLSTEQIRNAQSLDEILAVTRLSSSNPVTDEGIIYSRDVGQTSSEVIAKEV